jgi:hypothetical protein
MNLSIDFLKMYSLIYCTILTSTHYDKKTQSDSHTKQYYEARPFRKITNNKILINTM